ncbi:MAG TPA: DUF2007 domain-containing protein [Anaerolineae bacterium]|nr:DUF2007 domain-containing protein [Anaerolineae bacterium]
MREELDLVPVLITQGWDVAQIYKSKLEAADIPVLLKYEAVGPVMGITYDGLGAVQILVPREYEEEARELLDEEDLPDDIEADET